MIEAGNAFRVLLPLFGDEAVHLPRHVALGLPGFALDGETPLQVSLREADGIWEVAEARYSDLPAFSPGGTDPCRGPSDR